MVLGLDVLGALVVNGVLGQLDAALVVLEDGQGLLAFVLLLGVTRARAFSPRIGAGAAVVYAALITSEPDHDERGGAPLRARR